MTSLLILINVQSLFLLSVQSESRMARRRAGTTLAATTGSSPSERRTPRSCRTGRDSRGQQSRWRIIGFHPTMGEQMRTNPWYDDGMLLGEISMLCWWKSPLRWSCATFSLYPPPLRSHSSVFPQTKDIPKRPYSQSLGTVISPALAEVRSSIWPHISLLHTQRDSFSFSGILSPKTVHKLLKSAVRWNILCEKKT